MISMTLTSVSVGSNAKVEKLSDTSGVAGNGVLNAAVTSYSVDGDRPDRISECLDVSAAKSTGALHEPGVSPVVR